VIRWTWIEWIRGGLMFCAVVCATNEARAQAEKPAQGDSKAGAAGQKERSSAAG
jgi:hypothetical protein